MQLTALRWNNLISLILRKRVTTRVFFPTGRPKPEHSGSGKPDRFHRKLIETGQIPVQIQIIRRIWEPTGLTGIPAGLAGIPVGLTGNRSNSIFFLV